MFTFKDAPLSILIIHALHIRIGRGFYEDGVWVDNGFLPYHEIGGLSWREGDQLTLLFIPRMKHVARSLVVPAQFYGETRRLLRDKIARHDIDCITKMQGRSRHVGGQRDNTPAFWNLHDGQSWLNKFPWARVNHPLLFDRQGLPKPAFTAVLKELAAPRPPGPAK